jgi:hypothetical protein
MENKLRPEPIWELTSQDYENIVNSLRSFDELEEILIFFMPGEYGSLFNPESEFDKGIIAIKDAGDFLYDAQWYLIHALCFIKYLQDPNDRVVISRKYLEPSYLAIYSSLECLAKAIEILLAIDIDKYKGKKRGKTLFSKVGYTLRMDFQDLAITKASQRLFLDENIRKIIDFRHRWVHNQRIQIKDEALPIIREQSFWKKGANYHQYPIGAECRSHHYDIDEYSNIIRSAFNAYFEYFIEALSFLKDHICKEGSITFSVEKKKTDDGKTYFRTTTNSKLL